MLDRLDRVVRGLEAAPMPFDAADLTRAIERIASLWADLFLSETGASCGVGPHDETEALAVFRPCPAPDVDRIGYREWHAAHGRLFLRYAPLAAQVLGRDSPPGDRAATLLVADGLRLLRDHAAGLGRASTADDIAVAPAVPFASLFQRAGRSGGSSDVNLGAVALALAVESGLRHSLGVPGEARVSMWRLFRALADEAQAIRLTVELPTLVAVYSWAGHHRRAGMRTYGWLNYLAADLLHPLFVPQAPLAFGLAAEPDVLARLRAAALADDTGTMMRPKEDDGDQRPFLLESAAA